MSDPSFWATGYEALILRIPDYTERARMILGGFSTCVDRYLSLHDMERPRKEARGTPAEALFIELDQRAKNGIGGELLVDWPDGPHWLDERVAGCQALGGTNSQAAQQLALLGASALIAIGNRSATQLSVIHENVLVATENGVLPRKLVHPCESRSSPPHYIFEFTAGRMLGERTVPRSSRTIVRFAEAGLEHDAAFERFSVDLAFKCGAGIVCGFNGLRSETLDSELHYAAGISRAWSKNGLELIHFELGDYSDSMLRDRSLKEIGPVVTSIGMSLSELTGLVPGSSSCERKAIQLGETFGFSRVCVHADQWALVATQHDPTRELEALMMGCLLAASRATSGQLTVPPRLPKQAQFTDPPLPIFHRRQGWSIVCCPAPYIQTPAATIGLGDTFLAGTLLVLSALPSNAKNVTGQLPALFNP
jgi:ADP-dependent phosphofructokinase/glucokinase